MKIKNKFKSLEDYLSSNRLDVNGVLDDGWGAKFSVKGREIHAVTLFCDISSFSKRAYNLSPIETLIFVNNFFTWISAEALHNCPGIIDKYIGDEIMIVFSKEFGSTDPFVDAVQTARFMAEMDCLNFCPHMGIAAGNVVIGYVGTPLKYNCSVFGCPVTIASRCAGIQSTKGLLSTIVFPSEHWEGRDFNKVFPPRRIQAPDGKSREMLQTWELKDPRITSMKNMPDIEIIEIVNQSSFRPSLPPEDIARENFKCLKKEGSYHPLRYPFENDSE